MRYAFPWALRALFSLRTLRPHVKIRPFQLFSLRDFQLSTLNSKPLSTPVINVERLPGSFFTTIYFSNVLGGSVSQLLSGFSFGGPGLFSVMPSFDIVSQVNSMEIENAVNQAQ